MANDPKLEQFLLNAGWEHVMTEVYGCDTWSISQKNRDNFDWWPIYKEKYKGQIYWDLDEAVALQKEMDTYDVEHASYIDAGPPKSNEQKLIERIIQLERENAVLQERLNRALTAPHFNPPLYKHTECGCHIPVDSLADKVSDSLKKES